MQNKKLLLGVFLLLFVGFCALLLLLGLGGALLYTRLGRVTTTEVYATVVPLQSPAAIEETIPPTTSAPPTQPVLPSPASPLTSPEPTPNVDFNGIRFVLDLQLAQGVLPELVPASPATDADSMPGTVYPEYTQFTLQGYLLTDTYHAPRLSVYPLNEYRALDRLAGENADLLLRLLRDRPSNADDLPLLPLIPAAQMIQTQLNYLDFKNGSGLRYLTQLGQDVSPIHNRALIYTYQGITADQMWYVAAIFPVSHPSLPQSAETASWEIADPQAYYKQIEAQLAAEAADSFVPSLSLLDSLIASLRVW